MLRYFLLFIFFILVACTSVPQGEFCPAVSIPRESARTYVNNGKSDDFQITLAGVESYCFVEHSINRRFMAITPIFKVRKLNNTSTSVVDADFYVKTSINSKNYIGTRRFHQFLKLANNQTEQTIKGKKTITRIAEPPYNDFSVTVGFEMKPWLKEKIGKMFDIKMNYLSEEEIGKSQIDEVWLEVDAKGENIIWSESENKPIVVKKDATCKSCNK